LLLLLLLLLLLKLALPLLLSPPISEFPRAVGMVLFACTIVTEKKDCGPLCGRTAMGGPVGGARTGCQV